MSGHQDTTNAIAANRLRKQRRWAEELRAFGWTCLEPGEPPTASQVERRILRWIARHQVTQFRVRDLYQGLKGRRGSSVQKTADLQPAIDQLEVGNYLRRVEADHADSIIFEVNPLWESSTR